MTVTLGQTTTAEGQLVTGTEMHATVTDGHRVVVLGQMVTADGHVRVATDLGVGTQSTAPLTSILPAPHAVFGTGPVCASLRAVLSRHCRICSCVRSLFFWNINAMAPVTCGAAIDVPLMD
jgi:hypothetical protein